MKKILLLSLLVLGFAFAGLVDASVCPEGYVQNTAPMDSLTISCTTSNPVNSSTLTNGSYYVLEASGTCYWRTYNHPSGYLADAEYWLRNDTYGTGWTKMNGSLAFWDGGNVNIDWGDYNDSHVYTIPYVATADDSVQFYFRDDQYGDNSGSLNVNIYQCVLDPAEADDDGDGVLNDLDVCEGTVADSPSEYLGVNRWIWSGDSWNTFSKGKGKGPNFLPTMEATRGCSCEQILTKLNEYDPGLYGEMLGHWKFGCSQSIVEDWINLEIEEPLPEEPVLMETIEVYPSGNFYSSMVLTSGEDYRLEASGTFTYNNAGDWADAEWYLKNGVEVKGDTEGSKPYVLDLSIDGYPENIDWGDYQSTHEYTMDITGTGTPLNFFIYDSNYTDNAGFITVKIYKL